MENYILYALNLTEGNRVMSVTYDEYAPSEYPRVKTFPKGNISDYKYIDNEFVYDPLPEVIDNSARIAELKQNLADTDYIVIKVAEGVATWDEYPEIKEQRQAWRDEINQLESEQEVSE